jgi:hypothetical protein
VKPCENGKYRSMGITKIGIERGELLPANSERYPDRS